MPQLPPIGGEVIALPPIGGEVGVLVAKPAIKKKVEEKKSGSFVPSTGEFVSRMLKQVVSPVEPVRAVGKAAGNIIEGVERPSTDNSIRKMIEAAYGTIKEDPVTGTAKVVGSAAAGLTGIPSILEYLKESAGAVGDLGEPESYSPAARAAAGLPPEPTLAERLQSRMSKGAGMARGYAGGIVEGASSMSPLDALMLKAGMKGTPEGLKGPFRLFGESGKPKVGSPDLRAQYGGTVLSKGNNVVKGRESATGAGLEGDPFGGVVDPAVAEEALQQIIKESRPQEVNMSPAEPPPKSPTMGRTPGTAGGKPISDPSGGTKVKIYEEYTPEEIAEATARDFPDYVQEAAVARAAKTQETRAARDTSIDAEHRRILDEIVKRARQGASEEELDLPVPGTTRGEAYAGGATPAEAGKAAAAARAEGTGKALAATPGGKGRAPLPPMRKAVDPQARTKLLQQLKRTKIPPKSTLRARLTRFNFLAGQEVGSLTTAQAAELVKLEREVFNHPDMPPKLKARRDKLGGGGDPGEPTGGVPVKAGTPRQPGPPSTANAREKLPLLPRKSTTSPLMKEIADQRVEEGAAVRGTEADIPKNPIAQKLEIERQEALEDWKKENGITIPDEPITQRSQAVADSLAAEIPAAAPAPRAPIPPTEISAAIGESLGRSFSHTSLAPLLEQVRQGMGLGAEMAPEVRQVLEGMGQVEKITPEMQAFIDAIEEEIARRAPREGDPVNAASSVPFPEEIASGARSTGEYESLINKWIAAGKVAPSSRTPRIPVAAGGKIKFPTQMWPNRSRLVENASAVRRAPERAAKQRARETEAVREVPRITSIEDLKGARTEKVAPQTKERPKTIRDMIAAKKVAEGKLKAPTELPEIGPPPPGTEPELWARINAVEAEARSLMEEHGITDPRLVGEMRQFWGAAETGRRLGIDRGLVQQLAGGKTNQIPLKGVLEQMDARFRHLLDDPNGFMRIEALVAGSGAAAGGLVGATIGGEDPLEHLAYGLSGAIIGGALGFGAARGAQRINSIIRNPRKMKIVKDSVEAIDTGNLLAGPAVIKTSFGSMGGFTAGFLQRMQEGRVVDAARGHKYLSSMKRGGMVHTFYDTLTGPTAALRPGPYTSQVGHALGMVPTNNILTRAASQILRPFVAGDRAASKGLQLMGFSPEEAARLQMVGEPTSWMGQTFHNMVTASFAGRMLLKFPRVRVGGIERGIEFTPGLNRLINTRHVRAQVPARLRGSFKPQEQLSAAALKARGRIGGAYMLAGTAYGYVMDPSIQHIGVASSIAGPAYIPTAAAMSAGKALRGNKDALTEAVMSVVANVPQIGEADIRSILSGQRFLPLRPLRNAIERMQEK